MFLTTTVVPQGQVALTHLDGMAYADSRVIAEVLDNEHKTVVELLTKFQSEFEEFGLLRFETEKVSIGRPVRFALLTEDQCYLLLTYSRNSKKARDAKRALVHAFRQARELAAPQSPQDLSPLDLFRQMLTAYEAQESRLQLLEGSQVELEHRLDDTPISAHADKRNHVQKLIQELGNVKGGRSHIGLAYRRYKAHFGLAGAFDALKASDYPEAVALLTRWIMEAQKDNGNLYN